MTYLEELQAHFSDFHKDLYGFRPRYSTDAEWNSVQYLEDQIARLERAAPAIRAEEEAAEKLAIENFEFKVKQTIAIGAHDRETALRWLVDAADEFHKDEGFCEYIHGLPYGYINSHRS